MDNGRITRQETVMAIRSDQSPENYVRLLMQVVDQLSSGRRGLLRGETIALGHAIAAGTAANALYASIPVVFPAALSTNGDTAPQTVIVWLFPIHPAEIDLIESAGWSEFEDRLEAANPDLYDIYRNSVV
jgi:alpha-D-ribose 1-methylphosphonate 5-triphosphate synthase subunit PhnH